MTVSATAETEAAELAAALRTYCWDERDGFFYSVDMQCEQRRHPHRLFGELNINLTPFWNCLGPVWIIPQYLVWCGLRHGFTAEAAQVAARTRRVLAEEFRRSGVMYENYDPETGRGVACPGFWSWNILAAVME